MDSVGLLQTASTEILVVDLISCLLEVLQVSPGGGEREGGEEGRERRGRVGGREGMGEERRGEVVMEEVAVVKVVMVRGGCEGRR